MHNKFLPTCLQGNFRDSFGEFGNTSYGVFGVERVEHAAFKIQTKGLRLWPLYNNKQQQQ